MFSTMTLGFIGFGILLMLWLSVIADVFPPVLCLWVGFALGLIGTIVYVIVRLRAENTKVEAFEAGRSEGIKEGRQTAIEEFSKI
jgi:hypothetical protein